MTNELKLKPVRAETPVPTQHISIYRQGRALVHVGKTLPRIAARHKAHDKFTYTLSKLPRTLERSSVCAVINNGDKFVSIVPVFVDKSDLSEEGFVRNAHVGQWVNVRTRTSPNGIQGVLLRYDASERTAYLDGGTGSATLVRDVCEIAGPVGKQRSSPTMEDKSTREETDEEEVAREETVEHKLLAAITAEWANPTDVEIANPRLELSYAIGDVQWKPLYELLINEEANRAYVFRGSAIIQNDSGTELDKSNVSLITGFTHEPADDVDESLQERRPTRAYAMKSSSAPESKSSSRRTGFDVGKEGLEGEHFVETVSEPMTIGKEETRVTLFEEKEMSLTRVYALYLPLWKNWMPLTPLSFEIEFEAARHLTAGDVRAYQGPPTEVLRTYYGRGCIANDALPGTLINIPLGNTMRAAASLSRTVVNLHSQRASEFGAVLKTDQYTYDFKMRVEKEEKESGPDDSQTSIRILFPLNSRRFVEKKNQAVFKTRKGFDNVELKLVPTEPGHARLDVLRLPRDGEEFEFTWQFVLSDVDEI